MSDSNMQWGTTKMLSKDHKDECAKLQTILEPLKTTENFPNCFAKDDTQPDKVTIDKLGAMNQQVFGKFTRQSFASQVRVVGNRILRNQSKRGE